MASVAEAVIKIIKIASCPFVANRQLIAHSWFGQLGASASILALATRSALDKLVILQLVLAASLVRDPCARSPRVQLKTVQRVAGKAAA